MRGVELAVVLLAAAAAAACPRRPAQSPAPGPPGARRAGPRRHPRAPAHRVRAGDALLLFVPPLLYLTAFTTSLRDFRAQLGPIARYGTIVVLATMAAVAAVAHALLPEITWPAAFVLGAIVSPPDPVAAVAVMRKLGAPRRIMTVLEGEGLVNGATALVAYRIAVAAVGHGTSLPGSPARWPDFSSSITGEAARRWAWAWDGSSARCGGARRSSRSWRTRFAADTVPGLHPRRNGWGFRACSPSWRSDSTSAGRAASSAPPPGAGPGA